MKVKERNIIEESESPVATKILTSPKEALLVASKSYTNLKSLDEKEIVLKKVEKIERVDTFNDEIKDLSDSLLTLVGFNKKKKEKKIERKEYKDVFNLDKLEFNIYDDPFENIQ